ncbi:DUF3558 domain-containing protein [Amycolatopsis saalfeldensis]|uniref:DUF3558 domain-containing protein n=1 Tax=Amycolatopsis saalfeldensis TaxID=394193 RepID=A0A1H8YBY2_9PSEU|nr:DUF3558 domain-containing protein [Amycolatopsis saalfeldensis]SEP49596.1 Protein of unknown function [Amycolatopsis saalfeldensis]
MDHRTVVTAVAAAAILLAAGCTDQKAGGTPSPAPQPSASPSVPATQKPPFAGAPKVTNPLPSSVLSGSPCEALTPQQVQVNIGVSVAGKPDNLPGIGPQCTWTNKQTSAQMGVSFTTEPGDGLSGDYANTRPKMPVWKELPPIQGLPAVVYSDNSKPNPDFCAVAIGITDALSVDVTVALSLQKSGKVDACTVVPLTANDVVTTLKQKAGS